MDIFDLVDNEKFFHPLSSKNRKIYFECIVELIEKSKEVPVLYDSDARNCVAIYLKNSAYVYQNEAEKPEEPPQTSVPERNASDVMAYLRECGWVTPREIGRNGENVANVSSNCRRIIEFFRKLCEKSNEGALSNHIFSMYEILKSSFEEGSIRAIRPYSNILKPLLDHEAELKNELLDLKDNISNIMHFVMELQDANSVGKFLMRDELLDKFFNDYFFIKNNGLIPSQIAFIRNQLRALSQGELFQKIVEEANHQLQIDELEARERIEAWFSELQYFLAVEYEEHMELIDARINTYYNLANTRMMLVMGSGINMESALDAFLSRMKQMEEGERQKALEQVKDCMQVCSQKYVSRRSYERRRRRERNHASIGLEMTDISQEEKERRTREMISSTRNRFSMEEARSFLENRLAGNGEIELKEQSIADRKEAMMFAASVMYSDAEEFPYQVELEDDFVETDVARITNMKIRKKRAGKHGGI